MLHPPGPQDLATSSSTLTQGSPCCSYCGQKESPSLKLKRCTGCAIAMYCGKECQKSGWSAHRRECRPNSNSTKPEDPFDTNRLAGYPALIALNLATAEWFNVHQMTFAVMGSVVAHLNGTLDFSNPAASGKALVFDLVPVKARHEDNPARKFRLTNALLAPHAEFVPAAQEYGIDLDDWPKQMQERVRAELLEDTVGPSFFGVVPGIARIQGAGHVYFTQCHIRRMHHHKIVGERWRAVTQDLAAICIAVVNAGFVLTPGAADDAKTPDVGTLVQRKKKWDWVREKGWRWEWDYLASRMPSIPPPLTGLQPHHLWQLYFGANC
ncbi:hypothetical protein TRAPUB_6065 [Trametes pubescens]|uniref:MYND-type domain-containing protein n=1 Tax=Trametes pubescens TaxID=154538 RepID=A0A1M2V6W5_TRAPU|nr:hypothetical protein TRAPUB_6065 [Trametes pubescens]